MADLNFGVNLIPSGNQSLGSEQAPWAEGYVEEVDENSGFSVLNKEYVDNYFSTNGSSSSPNIHIVKLKIKTDIPSDNPGVSGYIYGFEAYPEYTQTINPRDIVILNFPIAADEGVSIYKRSRTTSEGRLIYINNVEYQLSYAPKQRGTVSMISIPFPPDGNVSPSGKFYTSSFAITLYRGVISNTRRLVLYTPFGDWHP